MLAGVSVARSHAACTMRSCSWKVVQLQLSWSQGVKEPNGQGVKEFSPQRPHDLADIARPRVSYTVAMAHGYCVDMNMAPEELNHGSDAFLEVLCRSISNVRRICRERN